MDLVLSTRIWTEEGQSEGDVKTNEKRNVNAEGRGREEGINETTW